jgi:hypothetical protein
VFLISAIILVDRNMINLSDDEESFDSGEKRTAGLWKKIDEATLDEDLPDFSIHSKGNQRKASHYDDRGSRKSSNYSNNNSSRQTIEIPHSPSDFASKNHSKQHYKSERNSRSNSRDSIVIPSSPNVKFSDAPSKMPRKSMEHRSSNDHRRENHSNNTNGEFRTQQPIAKRKIVDLLIVEEEEDDYWSNKKKQQQADDVIIIDESDESHASKRNRNAHFASANKKPHYAEHQHKQRHNASNRSDDDGDDPYRKFDSWKPNSIDYAEYDDVISTKTSNNNNSNSNAIMKPKSKPKREDKVISDEKKYGWEKPHTSAPLISSTSDSMPNLNRYKVPQQQPQPQQNNKHHSTLNLVSSPSLNETPKRREPRRSGKSMRASHYEDDYEDRRIANDFGEEDYEAFGGAGGGYGYGYGVPHLHSQFLARETRPSLPMGAKPMSSFAQSFYQTPVPYEFVI